MTITRAQAIALLEPKLSNIWQEAYPQWPVEYTSWMNIRTTRKATITDFKMTDFGQLRLKGEGENITYDDPIFGPTRIYQPVRYALGYKITQETIDHELYGQTTKLEKALMKSAVDGQEISSMLVLNNGFNTTGATAEYTTTGFDGLALFSTAHTRLDGGPTQRNRPTTDVDLSVTGVQNMVIDFNILKDDRGRPSMIRPKLLIVNPQDIFTARELLQSEYKPGTANNEINAVREEALTFMVSHYKTDTLSWFCVGDQHDLNLIWDVRPSSAMEDDFDSMVVKRRVLQGYAVGFGEWRGAWGTSGA